MERLLKALGILGFLRRHCRHEWQNTGLQCELADGVHVNLFQCHRCGETAIAQV